MSGWPQRSTRAASSAAPTRYIRSSAMVGAMIWNPTGRLSSGASPHGTEMEFAGEGYQAGVVQRFEESVRLLTELGAEVVEVSCPSFTAAMPAYYLIAPSECSSNLARFDAMRFGLRLGDDGDRGAEDVMALTRSSGFGPEVKRRIMLGTYALSSGYYDAYYGQAQKVRTLICRDFAAAYEQVDVLVSPTMVAVAAPSVMVLVKVTESSFP